MVVETFGVISILNSVRKKTLIFCDFLSKLVKYILPHYHCILGRYWDLSELVCTAYCYYFLRDYHWLLAYQCQDLWSVAAVWVLSPDLGYSLEVLWLHPGSERFLQLIFSLLHLPVCTEVETVAPLHVVPRGYPYERWSSSAVSRQVCQLEIKRHAVNIGQ